MFSALLLALALSSPKEICIPTADDSGIACTVEEHGEKLYGCVKGRAGKRLKRRRRAVLVMSWDIDKKGDVGNVKVRGHGFKVPKYIRKCLQNEIASWMFVPPEEEVSIKNTKLVLSKR